MRRWWLKIWLVIILLLCCQFSKAQNTSLTGTLTAPSGSLFNGYLWLSLAQPATVLGTCTGGPVYVLPNIFLSIQVVNGALVGSPAVWGADCLDPTGVPYNVQIKDMNGNTLVTDQWLIQGTSFNVGTATSALYTNTVTIPYVSQITGPTGVSTGAITFTGAGVSQSGNTYTFNGSGGSGGNINNSTQYNIPYYSNPGTSNALSGSNTLHTDASNNWNITSQLNIGALQIPAGTTNSYNFIFKNLSALTGNWTFDYTTPLTAINSLAPIPINDLAQIPANSLLMNNTAGTANAAAVGMPTCTGTGYADIYDTTSHGWVCNQITAAVIPNALTFNTTGGAAPNASYNGSSTLTVDYHTVGAAQAGSAEFAISFSPVIGGIVGGFVKAVKTSTVDNIEGSAQVFSCTTNPTVTLYECGTSTTCTTPTALGTTTVTAAGTVVDGTITSATVTAGDYVAWEITAGVCTSLNINVSAMLHTN